MRMEFKVCPSGDHWEVRRGVTAPLPFASFDAAVRAARTLAQSATEAGDVGVLKIADRSVSTFQPRKHVPARHARYDPDEDQNQRHQRELLRGF